MGEKSMKKRLLALLLAGCMVFSMTACGSKEEENTETAEITEEVVEQEVDRSAMGTSKLISLGEYKGLSYVPMDTTVTDQEVEDEMQYVLENSYTINLQDVAMEDSIVNIDYEGKKDGVAFEGGTAQGYELDLANSNFIDGFAESIVGMKAGETKDCPMTFPEDYHAADLAGEEVVFTITLNRCWEEVPAELTEEFAQTNGFDSIEAFYAGIRSSIEKVKQSDAEADMEYQLLTKIIANSEFELNEAEVELYIYDLKTQYESYATYLGYDLETYIMLIGGISMDEFEVQCRDIAIYRIQCPLIEDAIIEAEKLEVTDEYYAEKAEEYRAYYGYETVEAMEETYTKETVMSQVAADLACDFIGDHAVAEEAAAEE